MQMLAELHDTPNSTGELAPLGWGMGWTAQLVPFQCSANAPLELRVTKNPTAVHELAELHDTAFSSLDSAPLGTRVCWIAQLVPFQRSANIVAVPLEVKDSPTAIHELAEVHDTPSSWLLCAPLGRGAASSTQLVPFQRSASGDCGDTALLLLKDPTAVHELAELHDTPLRMAKKAPLGLGVAWTVQLLPFQRSASGAPPEMPTVMHEVAEVHDTACRALELALGLGLGSIAQRLPFQRSASVFWRPVPTAMHAFAALHDTPIRAPCGCCAFGV